MKNSELQLIYSPSDSQKPSTFAINTICSKNVMHNVLVITNSSEKFIRKRTSAYHDPVEAITVFKISMDCWENCPLISVIVALEWLTCLTRVWHGLTSLHVLAPTLLFMSIHIRGKYSVSPKGDPTYWFLNVKQSKPRESQSPLKPNRWYTLKVWYIEWLFTASIFK